MVSPHRLGRSSLPFPPCSPCNTTALPHFFLWSPNPSRAVFASHRLASPLCLSSPRHLPCAVLSPSYPSLRLQCSRRTLQPKFQGQGLNIRSSSPSPSYVCCHVVEPLRLAGVLFVPCVLYENSTSNLETMNCAFNGLARRRSSFYFSCALRYHSLLALLALDDFSLDIRRRCDIKADDFNVTSR